MPSKMETTVQTLKPSVPHRSCVSLEEAYEAAVFEAANTVGVVLRVKSIRIGPNFLIVTGLVPVKALVFDNRIEFSGRLRPRSIGSFHQAQSSYPQPNTAEDLGYLVLQTPVVSSQVDPKSEDGDSCWVAVAIERTFHTLKPGCVGAVCCALCNRPISQQRLLAVPDARLCTDCQREKEKK